MVSSFAFSGPRSVRAQSSTWQALDRHCMQIGSRHLRQLFSDDSQRGQRMAIQAGDLYLDYSKNRLTGETLSLLQVLARECGLSEKINAMFSGKKINLTEHRAALHIALRSPVGDILRLDGINVVSEAQQSLMQMRLLSDQIREGRLYGDTGKVIKNIVNIGIGGSDLGPVMAYDALRFYCHRDLCFRFVSNIDSSDFVEATRDLNPEETLFIICSKSFATSETLNNAHLAKAWSLAKLKRPESIPKHFIAVSANEHGVADFGIDISKMFILWDWVGGRYSIDAAIGLSTMIAIGASNFHDFLTGMHEMDQHFLNAPLHENMPVLLGLIAIWNNNFLHASTAAIFPYSHYLKRFPAYLQQLMMESNGKHVDIDGKKLDIPTCPVYWGEPGTNGQHSFFQLLHQGTPLVAMDFIGFCQSLHPQLHQHDLLMANCFSQTEALAFGRSAAQFIEDGESPELAVHRACEGNRPSNTILAESLTPSVLGQLIALYEHSVFTQGAVWNLNSFDQWGVELGKTMASEMIAELSPDGTPRQIRNATHDSSTQTLMQRYCQYRLT